jgi:FKBP-type peptidyl-prolyl cis-trans isomerases 1
MLGMKVGEVREVWIHPDLASCSAVPTGVHGKIQLLHIEHAPDLDPISTNWIEPLRTTEPEELLERRWTELQCKFAAAYGHVNGRALRYISDIEKVINAFELQKEPCRELSPKEEEMVSSFKIYHFEKQKAEQDRIALKKFASLTPDVTCLIKDRLYVKCIKEGLGPIIKKTDKVKLQYCFKNDEAGVILDETLATCDLENEIAAFQLAIPGHRVGTKMSLYIHPELGFKSYVWPVGNVFLFSGIEILETQD